MSSNDLPAYTSLEVAKHTSRNDAWIIVGGRVLDVSNWLDEHPGGDVVLLDAAGHDATREFEDVGHSDDARAQLDKLVVGILRPATDEELHIAPLEGDEKESKGTVFSVTKDISEWIRANSKQVRQIGIASAAVFFAIVFVRRYVAPYFQKPST